MIKLKDILLEGKSPSIFVPRRTEDRVERMIKSYVRNGSKGTLDLGKFGLIELPSILKDIDVEETFSCANNKLTSLDNLPKSIGKNFYCYDNQLTSLIGSPERVNGDFFCHYNKLTTLFGAPKYVGGTFYCNFNDITSLVGAPVIVGETFDCSYNKLLTSLEGVPKTVGKDFIFNQYRSKGKKLFTEEQIRAVCDVKGKVYIEGSRRIS